MTVNPKTYIRTHCEEGSVVEEQEAEGEAKKARMRHGASRPGLQRGEGAGSPGEHPRRQSYCEV